jgi:xylose isomerase
MLIYERAGHVADSKVRKKSLEPPENVLQHIRAMNAAHDQACDAYKLK